MKKHEFSKLDFDLIDRVLAEYIKIESNPVQRIHARDLRELFESAHTGWLEIEEDGQ